MKKTFVVGTRGSKLALTQTKWVISELEKHYPECKYEINIIKTQGDIQNNVPLEQIGGKGVFVKDIESALLDGQIDFAVHSMKDVPARLPEGLKIGAVPPREDPRDVLISNGNLTLDELPKGSRIGTSSLRRGMQLKKLRPDIELLPIRGNVDTRIKKMRDGQYDGIILAAAGLNRLGDEYKSQITQYLGVESFIPAVSQAALGIEVCEGSEAEKMVKALHDASTTICVGAERAFLSQLNGNCKIPIAAYATIDEETLTLSGGIAKNKDGVFYIGTKKGSISSYEKIGKDLANQLIEAAGITLDDWLEICQNEG